MWAPGFSPGTLPFRYLGATIVIDRLKVSDFEPLMQGQKEARKAKSLTFVVELHLSKQYCGPFLFLYYMLAGYLKQYWRN